MRIITGSAKGSRLKAPKGLMTRPTADRVKESMFNILGSAVRDARVLDLFAGTGNLGLEALSRGADKATFVDQSPESVRAIAENALRTKLREAAEIVKGDVFSCLRRLSGAGNTFDLVFCDPPYQKGLAKRTLEILDALDVLEDGAIVVVEHDRGDALAASLCHLEHRRCERYGQTAVGFFIYREAGFSRDERKDG